MNHQTSFQSAFLPTEFHTEMRSQLHKFCSDQLEPLLEDDDEKEIFRPEIIAQLGELGVTGMTTSEKFGGQGLSLTDFCEALLEIAKCSVPYAVTISVSTMVQSILENYGSEEQKNRYLPPLASGKAIGAFCLSESGSGSDARSLKTSAKKVSGGYILHGNKMWITSGGVAKTYIVMARTDNPQRPNESHISAFIVEDGTKGLSFGKKEKKMGWRTSPTREVIFDQCFIPDDNLIMGEGKGFHVALSALDKGRITIGAIAVGLSERALEEATRYALFRQQFQKPIFEFQGLQFMLADMNLDYECAKILVQKAASLYDAGVPHPKISSMAKLKSTDAAMSITTDALQIFGGVGYTKEYPMERMMRDAKVLQIVEGTNQIQKSIIAKEMKKEFSPS